MKQVFTLTLLGLGGSTVSVLGPILAKPFPEMSLHPLYPLLIFLFIPCQTCTTSFIYFTLLHVSIHVLMSVRRHSRQTPS